MYTRRHRLNKKKKNGILRNPIKGEKMPVTKCISELGRATRFGPDWQGKRCLAKTRKGTLCQSPAYKQNGRCRLHGGLSTGPNTNEGKRRIAVVNFRNGKFTKEKLQYRKNVAHVGKRVVAELNSIEQRLIDAGLYDPTDYG